jgi:hypothetical protein
LQHNGGLPDGAVVDSIQPISAQVVDRQFSEIIAYVIRYRHDIDGLQVRSNGIEDYISVVVNDDGVVAISQHWSTIYESEQNETINEEKKLLNISEALNIATNNITEVLKGREISFVSAIPVYATTTLLDGERKLVPAYRIQSTEGTSIVINAITGDIVF